MCGIHSRALARTVAFEQIGMLLTGRLTDERFDILTARYQHDEAQQRTDEHHEDHTNLCALNQTHTHVCTCTNK
jgi:hypothetical protein